MRGSLKPQNCLDDGPFYGQYKRGSDEFIGYLFLSILCCYDNCLANNDEEGEDDEDEDEFDMKEEQQVSHYILYQDDDSTTDDNTEGGVNIVSSDGSSLSSNCMSIGSVKSLEAMLHRRRHFNTCSYVVKTDA